jgi:hypothetical protein
VSPIKIAAIALLVAGTLGLVYGGFTYTKDTHRATLGPLELSVQEKNTINIPVGAGVGAVVLGAILLLVPRSARS